MNKILIAPDSFKGSLSAVEFCQLAEEAIIEWSNEHQHPIEVISRPMSDGGEGFVESLLTTGQFEAIESPSCDPLRRPLEAQFAWQSDTQTAVIEMAQASGLPLLSDEEKDPLKASTYGSGLQLKQAIEMGAKTIMLGLGGSATNDGGVGALQALGVKFFNKDNQEIGLGGEQLQYIQHLEQKVPGLVDIRWVLGCDVTNPLLGPKGATAVFGPQKGVDATNFAILEAGLENFAHQIEIVFGRSVQDLPGAGAAGGMAAGFIGVLNAEIESGFELLSELLALKPLFEENSIDLVITGEGQMDAQTAFGKLPAQIADLAQTYQVPTLALCGRLDASPESLSAFKAVHSVHPEETQNLPLKDLMALTPKHLQQSIKQQLSALLL